MTFTRHPAPKLRLARLMERPGGLTIEEALERAEAGLAQIAPPCRESLDRALAQADSLGRSLGGAPTAETLSNLYALGDEIVGLAGPAGEADVGAAAYSLCELVDRYQTGAAIKPEAVRVHLDALTLLRRPASATGGDAGRRAVLEGLSRIVRGVN